MATNKGTTEVAETCRSSRSSKLTTLVMVGGEAAALMYIWQQVWRTRWVVRFVSLNELHSAGRTRLMESVAASALAAIVATLLYAWKRKQAAWSRLDRLARLASPLLVLWAVPAMVIPGGYDGRDLQLLLSAALIVVLGERCLCVALHEIGALPSIRSALARWRLPDRWAHLSVAVLSAGYVLVASSLSVRLHDKLITSTLDLGLFENLMWNTLHGAHGIALQTRYFATHAELVLYALLPFYALVPRAETLLVIQSALVGGSMIPLYLLGRRWLQSSWQACVLTAAFAFYPAVHGPTFYDFHFLTLSVFFVLWGAWFVVTRRWVWFWLAVVVAMACREDVSLGLMGVGLGLACTEWRRRTGIALLLLAAAWFVSIKFLWMTTFGDQSFAEHYARLVAPGEGGFTGILRTLLSNPLYVLATMMNEEKLVLALHLLVPLAFLPVRQSRTAFLLFPGVVVVGLSTSRSALNQIAFQYTSHFTPYLFVSVTAALAALARNKRLAALGAVCIGTAIAASQFGAVRWNHYTAGFQQFDFAWTVEDQTRLQDLGELVAMIPQRASVSAGEHEGPHVARRAVLLSLKERVDGADYVLWGRRSFRWGGKESVLQCLGSGKYGVVATRGEFGLLRRGAATDRNVQVSEWLRRDGWLYRVGQDS